ncbi:MAG: hypothetical protein JW864_09250 [Spirochaetes bacterium]|nr:hypothetical protein [Spirochaetota bacterium]
MKKVVIFVCLILFFISCENGHLKVPQGNWKYSLYVNGIKVGTANISNKITNNTYISSSEYIMKMNGLTTITKDVIIETLDFKPVRLESYSKIDNSGEIHENKIVSVFNGREVELSYGDKKAGYTVDRDFIIDGNFFMGKLFEGKFREGMEVSGYIYNPSVELETPVKATTRVVGFKDVLINGKEKKLLHISQSIENLNDNVDLFIDKEGILQKGVIYMLNIKIELVKI